MRDCPFKPDIASTAGSAPVVCIEPETVTYFCSELIFVSGVSTRLLQEANSSKQSTVNKVSPPPYSNV